MLLPRRCWCPGAASSGMRLYLISKLAVYLLIGLAFYSLFTALDRPPGSAFAAADGGSGADRAEHVGRAGCAQIRRGTIRNQLPGAPGGFCTSGYRACRPGGWQLHVSVVLLGALVASVEFLCRAYWQRRHRH